MSATSIAYAKPRRRPTKRKVGLSSLATSHPASEGACSLKPLTIEEFAAELRAELRAEPSTQLSTQSDEPSEYAGWQRAGAQR